MSRLTPWLVTLTLLAALLAVVVDSVYRQHRTRQKFAQLQVLVKQAHALNQEWGRLQSEYSTKVDNGLIERFARQQLGMKKPDNEQIITIRRQ
jgi:cell division protein FtsL